MINSNSIEIFLNNIIHSKLKTPERVLVKKKKENYVLNFQNLNNVVFNVQQIKVVFFNFKIIFRIVF